MRIEQDSLGAIEVPVDALWGAGTERARRNFDIGGRTLPAALIHALGLVKWAAATANGELGELEPGLATAIGAAALEVAAGRHPGQFPVNVLQTGSGTSSNMNANEVIARLAATASGRDVHPNDHVNRCQSSNDVFPTAIHLAAALALRDQLLPALAALAATIGTRMDDVGQHVKTGRTHLMDALPLTLGQELGAWRTQVDDAAARLAAVQPRLHRLALGGTAVGSGQNAHPRFAGRAIALLAARTGLALVAAPDRFASLAAPDAVVELSGQLRGAALVLLKIANDLRWMNSGPLAGLGEITLPALQPGSSIMPGKVNPVIPEAVAMAAVRVIGNDTMVALAGSSGNFQLNVMLPLLGDALLESIELLAGAAHALGERALAGFTVDAARLAATLAHNPMLVTALTPEIGYDRAARIAERVRREGRSVLEVAVEESGLPRKRLEQLLDPRTLAQGGGGRTDGR